MKNFPEFRCNHNIGARLSYRLQDIHTCSMAHTIAGNNNEIPFLWCLMNFNRHVGFDVFYGVKKVSHYSCRLPAVPVHLKTTRKKLFFFKESSPQNFCKANSLWNRFPKSAYELDVLTLLEFRHNADWSPYTPILSYTPDEHIAF